MALPKTTSTTTSSFTTTQDMAEHPNPIPNPHHRKIDLQSHGDLTYLQQNLALAAREKLDLYFPPQQAASTKPQPKSAPPATIISLDGGIQDSSTQQPEPENQSNTEDPEPEVDPLRAPVTALINDFLLQTYTSASKSITVNGIDASSLPSTTPFPNASNPTPLTNSETTVPLDPSQEVEGIHYVYAPFDRKLQKQMQALYEEVEALTGQVATLRRETPKMAAERYGSALENAIKQEEESWEAEQRRVQAQSHIGLEFSGIKPGWNEDVRGVYERGVGDLAVLSGVMGGSSQGRDGVASLTETVGKAERARAVAGEFE